VLKGIEGMWRSTGDGKYFRHIQQSMDHFVNSAWTIRTYTLDDYNLDNYSRVEICSCCTSHRSGKYRKAAALLPRAVENSIRALLRRLLA